MATRSGIGSMRDGTGSCVRGLRGRFTAVLGEPVDEFLASSVGVRGRLTWGRPDAAQAAATMGSRQHAGNRRHREELAADCACHLLVGVPVDTLLRPSPTGKRYA